MNRTGAGNGRRETRAGGAVSMSMMTRTRLKPGSRRRPRTRTSEKKVS